MISIVINLDSRKGFKESESTAEHMFQGCRSIDFLLDGVRNKIKFFDGFEKEVILFVDEHETIPQDVVSEMQFMCDTLVIRKHTTEPNFNDNNYLRALQLASGDIIAKFDADSTAFTSSPDHIKYLIGLLDTYQYVSYPSHWSPNAVHDPSYNYKWVSTRFFMCKRETLNFSEIKKCLTDYEYFCNTYKPSKINPWTEHALGLIANSSVIYPPVELDKYTVFCWNHYKSGVLGKLNNMSYEEVKNYINECTGIHYPNDVTCKQI